MNKKWVTIYKSILLGEYIVENELKKYKQNRGQTQIQRREITVVTFIIYI